MSTFTVHDLATLLRGDEELAWEFLLGPEGFLERKFVRQAGKDAFELTPAGWKVVRTLGYCSVERVA